jgi:sensor histidine kinase YesM
MREIFNTESNSLNSKQFVLMKWLVFWLLLTFVGLVISVSFIIARSASGQSADVLNVLNSQLLRFQIWAAFSPVIIFLDQKYRAKFKSWFSRFPVHFGSSIIWSAVVLGVYGVIVWFLDGLINSRFSTLAEVFATVAVFNFAMGIVGYKIILTTNYALDYYKKFQDEKHRSAKLEAQLAQAQLNALKMQLQPHFLFNTLNSISNLALEDPRKTVQMIARLGDFLRLTIDSNGTQQMSLEQELEFLKNYLEIEQIRFRDRLDVKFNIAPETLSAKVPNLILQPIVENAIKHGIAKSLSAGEIRIIAKRNADVLQLEIQNDGAFLNGNGYIKEGVGIANTRERLQQLYGNEFRFELKPLEKGGARVVLEIPFEEILKEKADNLSTNEENFAYKIHERHENKKIRKLKKGF